MSSIRAFNPSRSLPTGTLVGGRYRILRRLEVSALRVSYLATDVRAANDAGGAFSLFRHATREVVLDVYNDVGSSLAAWKRQAGALEALEHPALPKYYAHERLPGGEFAVVRGSAVGKTLRQRIDAKERWGTERLVRLAGQLLDVLSYLHEQSPPIFHGGITPDNVVVDDDDKVQLLGLRPETEELRSSVGTNAATSPLGYAAPETDVERRGASSDLYSVGAVLVRLFTRVPPDELPRRGGALDVGSHARVEPWFAEWLARLLAPDPNDGFRNATEAQRALTVRVNGAAPSPTTPSYATSGARVSELGKINASANTFGLRGPFGTRIVTRVQGETLNVEIGGVGFAGRGSRGDILALLISMGFIAMFTAVFLLAGSVHGMLFLIPFWGVVVVIGLSAAFTMWGKITIQVGPSGASVSRQLWRWSRHQQAPLAHWSGARVALVSDRGQRFECCISLGLGTVWFGHGLSLAEQHWLTDLLNGWVQRCLGTSANG